MRNKSTKSLEARRRRSSRAGGVLSIAIGVLFLAGGIFFLAALGSTGGLIVMLVFALVFIGAGVYFFRQVDIEEQRNRALDDPDSKAYQKRQQINAKKREKYLRNAEHHGSLKRILCRRAALIWGAATVGVWLLSAVLFLAGIFFFILPVLDIAVLFLFLTSLFGRQYRQVLAEYAEHGLDRTEAELDFAFSRAYLVASDVLSVSQRFLLSSADLFVLPVAEIVWIYSAYDEVQHYDHGLYSHTERKYCVIAALSNGMQYKIRCPEELCSVLVSDVADAGQFVTVGFSDEIQAIYDSNPEALRTAVKDQSRIITDPVGPAVYHWDEETAS